MTILRIFLASFLFRSRKSRRGFALIELLVVVGLLAILFTLGAVIFGNFGRQDQIMIETRKVGNLINEARTKTIAGYSLGTAQALNFGVHFENDRYVLFSGLAYDPQGSNNQKFLLPRDLEFKTISLPSNQVVFKKISGEVLDYNPSQNYLILGDKNSSEERKISVNQLGMVKIEEL